MTNQETEKHPLHSLLKEVNAREQGGVEHTARKLFSEQISELLTNSVLSQFSREGGETEFVVHYTTMSATVNILKSGFFRMYHAATLNDPKEGGIPGCENFSQHALNYVLNCLGVPQDNAESAEGDKPGPGYILSFSSCPPLSPPDRVVDAEDDLKYWLSYGDRGRGCSIKISTSALKIALNDGASGAIWRVRYGNETNESVMDKIKPVLTPLVDFLKQRNDEEYMAHGIRAIRHVLTIVGYFFKDQRYQHEDEWRIIKVVTDNQQGVIEIDDRNPALVRRYIKGPETDILDSGALITVGPSARLPDEAVKSILLLRDKNGLKPFGVKPSTISFRTF